MGVSSGKFILPPSSTLGFWLGDPLVHVPATEDFMIHILPQRVANPEISSELGTVKRFTIQLGIKRLLAALNVLDF